jgi:hypothetical protein
MSLRPGLILFVLVAIVACAALCAVPAWAHDGLGVRGAA